MGITIDWKDNLEISKIDKITSWQMFNNSESRAKTDWSAMFEHINISMKVKGGLESSRVLD